MEQDLLVVFRVENYFIALDSLNKRFCERSHAEEPLIFNLRLDRAIAFITTLHDVFIILIDFHKQSLFLQFLSDF